MNAFRTVSDHEAIAKGMAARQKAIDERNERLKLLAPRDLDEGLDLSGDGKVVKKVLDMPDNKGERAAPGDMVRVRYSGWVASTTTPVALSDSVVNEIKSNPPFDSTSKRPFSFILGAGRVIMGWDLTVGTMRKGERSLVLLSPDYAYGPRGAPPTIPPKAWLLFEIELLDFKVPSVGPSKPEVVAFILAVIIAAYYMFFFTGKGGTFMEEEG